MIHTSEATKENVYRLRQSNREIVEGICEGDQEAARALVKQYGQTINGRVWRLLGADQEHDDIVQQVFIAILKSIPKLKDPDALPDWIGKITVNTVRNELRSRRMRRIFSFTDSPPDVPSSSADPESQLIAKRGFAILNKLNDEDRILFIMRFMEGTDLKTISRQTGHSLATVKRRLAKARDTFLKKAKRDDDVMSLFQEGSSV